MKSLAISLYLAAAIYAGVNLLLFPRWTVDDAYITFHYAENLAEHGQLTWNIGEPPVEGYTGVLLPVALAGWMKLGGSPDFASDAIGIASFFAAGLFIALCLRLAGAAEPVPAAATLLYCTAPFMFTHATSGLETQLFAALCSGALLALIACLRAGPRRAATESLLCAILLLAGLARPEGAALAGIFGGALFVARWLEGPRAAARFALRFALIFVIPGAAYFIWRWNYYGALLPNTYYAKSWFKSRDADASLSKWIDYTVAYLLLPFGAALIAAALGALGGRKLAERTAPSGWQRPSLLWAAAPAAAFVALLLAKYFRTALTMNYSYRFYAPLHPFMLIGAGALAARGWAALQAGAATPSARRAFAGAAIAALALQLFWHVRFLPAERDYAQWYRRLLEDEHVAISHFLMEHVPQEEWILVFKDAGVIPYMTKMKTIDFGRLNDAELARGRLTDEQQRDYFYSRMPGALVITSGQWLVADYYKNNVLDLAIADPRWKQYRLARKYRLLEPTRKPPYYEFLYLRKDLFDLWIAKVGLDARATNDPRDKTTVGDVIKAAED